MVARYNAALLRALGLELRRAREAAKISQVELAAEVKISKSTISRIERAERGTKLPTVDEVTAILVGLGASSRKRKQILAMVDDLRQPNWLAIRMPDLPRQLLTLADYESRATRITNVNIGAIPGLLQTREYAYQVFRAVGLDRVETERRITARLDRQHVFKREEPVEFVAIIDEPVLARPVGGRKIALAQLRHIVTMLKRPNVTVQIIPYEQGAHPVMDGSHILLEFAEEPPVAHVEHRLGGTFVDQEGVEEIVELTTTLRELALSPERSTELIKEMTTALEGR